MSKFLILSLLTLATGCGRAPVVAPEASAYLQAFVGDAAAHGLKEDASKVSIEFGTVDAGEKGMCVYDDNRVILDRVFWDTLGNTGKMLLVYHELGHCILKRQHRNDLFPAESICTKKDQNGACLVTDTFGEKPVSIMNASMAFPDAVDADSSYRQSLVDELFSKE